MGASRKTPRVREDSTIVGSKMSTREDPRASGDDPNRPRRRRTNSEGSRACGDDAC